MGANQARITRRRLLALGGAVAGLGCVSIVVRASDGVRVLAGDAFGTQWRITLPANAKSDGLITEITALIDELDRTFSPWRSDSVLARFNVGHSSTVEVPAELARTANAALTIAEQSGGLFDPTVGPLVARWGFGPISGDTDPEAWRDIEVKDDFVIRRNPALTLDLCGIAKGHALDRLTAMIEQSGCREFLVDLGGELAARGEHPSGRPWQVAIESPDPSSQEAVEIVSLDGQAIATSGDRINSYDLGGRRYSHIIDPVTAEPVVTSLASVSVIAATGLEADGWATALMAAGDEGPELARRLNLSALFVYRDNGGVALVDTGEFNRHKA